MIMNKCGGGAGFFGLVVVSSSLVEMEVLGSSLFCHKIYSYQGVGFRLFVWGFYRQFRRWVEKQALLFCGPCVVFSASGRFRRTFFQLERWCQDLIATVANLPLDEACHEVSTPTSNFNTPTRPDQSALQLCDFFPAGSQHITALSKN